jgi:hypothetical protein
MPAGTRTVLSVDLAGVGGSGETALRHGLTWCAPSCEHVPDATIELHRDTLSGVVRFTLRGQAKVIPFRALECPAPAGQERVICG